MVPVQWSRRGRVFCPEGQHEWMASHASNPVAESLGGNLFRIYFGSRDRQNRSHIAHVIVELTETMRVLELASQPDLSPGELGTFDESGTSMGSLVQHNQTTYLYYMGWNLCLTVPWRNSIGLAIRTDPNGSFRRYAVGPILDRSPSDPFTLSYPFTMKDGARWRMYYGSHLTTGRTTSDFTHAIKYAESADGISWTREGHVAVDLLPPAETMVCRPCVIKRGGTYHMWYSARSAGSHYTLGYAFSADGRCWDRHPSGKTLSPSGSGWDAETIAYPFVFEHQGRLHLLYNGDGYGRTGFGLAVEDR